MESTKLLRAPSRVGRRNLLDASRRGKTWMAEFFFFAVKMPSKAKTVAGEEGGGEPAV